MTQNTRGGFTLIELLVVIAIIGIIATIVLASLGDARRSATDAKVQAQLSSMRAQAELYALGHGGSYGAETTDCNDATGTLFSPDDPNSLRALLAAMPSGYTPTCVVTTAYWGVIVRGGIKSYCVDDTGQVASSLTTATPGSWCYSQFLI